MKPQPSKTARKIKHLDLFSGIGGFAYAVDNVWDEAEHIFCEWDEFCQQVIKKHWPEAKQYGDIKSITDTTLPRAWKDKRGLRQEPKRSSGRQATIDLLTGGFPCQPFSAAGVRRGTADERYLWPEMLRVIRLTKPTWVIAENVRGLLTWNEGLVFEQVCTDLENEGYEVQPFIIPALAVNAPHRRDRIWWVARNTESERGKTQKREVRKGQSADNNRGPVTDSISQRSRGRSQDGRQVLERQSPEVQDQRPDWSSHWLEVATFFCQLDDGFRSWLDRHFNDVIQSVYYEKTKKHPEALQVLLKAIRTPKIRKAVGGLYKMDETEVLLETVRQFERRISQPKRLHSKSKEVQGNELLQLWNDHKIRRTPQRWKYQEQLARKLTDIMPQLPHEVALEVVETGDILWQSYSAIFAQAVDSNGFKLSAPRSRKEQLKAYGNAIVPQVAIEIFKAIKEANP